MRSRVSSPAASRPASRRGKASGGRSSFVRHKHIFMSIFGVSQVRRCALPSNGLPPAVWVFLVRACLSAKHQLTAVELSWISLDSLVRI